MGTAVPDQDSDPTRPPISADLSADAFERWYWPVDQLKALCEMLGLSAAGSKAELRARLAFALRHPTATPPRPTRKKRGRFNWAKESLTRDTVITETVSFGPNVRRFFQAEIGASFVCHGDFMDWMRNAAGATLGDAIVAWHMLEDRKADPAFRREIAACNNYLQYLRDARDRHPDLSQDAAKRCWDYKKIRPASDGIVIFEDSDIARAGTHDAMPN
ncbi:MAG: DUF6434 domain-containing protein [Pseudomonadota bacterium]